MSMGQSVLKQNNYVFENFVHDELTIIFKETETEVRLEWIGRSIIINPEEKLTPYFDRIIKHLKGKDLIVDFTKLEYMNLSTLPPIIYFLAKLGRNKIKSIFYYKHSLEWQRRSFSAFDFISHKVKNISIQGC